MGAYVRVYQTEPDFLGAGPFHLIWQTHYPLHQNVAEQTAPRPAHRTGAAFNRPPVSLNSARKLIKFQISDIISFSIAML